VLYKYLSPARLSVIDNFMIRFTQPSQLNDPFESALLIDISSYDAYETSEAMIEQLALEVECETEEERIQLEAAKAEMRQYAKDLLLPHKVGKDLAEHLDRAQGVLSLSRTNDSLLMWAHYSDSHRGYAIGVDEKHPFFSRKDNTGEPTKIQNVIYTSRRVLVDPRSPDFAQRMLCYKSLEWAYEEEVRVFTTFSRDFSDFEKHKVDQIHLFALPRDCIKEIYIGANASPETRAAILATVDRRKLDVKVFEAYVADDRYALNFREVSEPIYSYRPREIISRSKTQPEYCDSKFTFSGSHILVSNSNPLE
jgi:hypothetical protein